MAARIMWGTANDAARSIDPKTLDRAREDQIAVLDPGDLGIETGDETDALDWPVIPATQLIYVIEDEGPAKPFAVADESVAGRPDVLAEAEIRYKNRTGREDVRPDAAAEPPGMEQPTTAGTAGHRD